MEITDPRPESANGMVGPCSCYAKEPLLYNSNAKPAKTTVAVSVRRSVSDWLRFMRMAPAGPRAELDRYIGYWKPYATSHDELDRDDAIQEEVRNAARTLAQAVETHKAEDVAGADLEDPRHK
jgi:hypothetical protein